MARLTRHVALVFVLGAAFILPVQAFNPGAHIYIAKKALATDDPTVWYGSIAPDLAWYSSDPGKLLAWSHTNLDLRTLTQSTIEEAFARGWAAHGEITGADRMAHWEWDRAVEGYVVERAKLLTRLPEAVRLDIGHKAIEAAIDLLLKRQDPILGQRVAAAAAAAEAAQVSAFMARGFATQGVGAPAVMLAKGTFDYTLVMYAGALNLPAPYDLQAVAQLGVYEAAAYGYVLTPEEARAVIEQAMDVCHDYMRVINEAVRQVKENQ